MDAGGWGGGEGGLDGAKCLGERSVGESGELDAGGVVQWNKTPRSRSTYAMTESCDKYLSVRPKYSNKEFYHGRLILVSISQNDFSLSLKIT